MRVFCSLIIGFLLYRNTLFAQANKTIVIGFGVNSTANYQPILKEDYVPEAIPLIMISPGLHFKVNSSELFIATDFFPWAHFYDPKYKLEMCGGQVEYKYHFNRKNKKYDFFISSYVQYCQIRTGGSEPLPFNDKSSLGISEVGYPAYKIKSLTNMYGIGFQYTFLKRIHAYASMYIGYNLNELKGVDYDWSDIFLENRINFISSFRLGLLIDIFKKTKI
jgi:hypothetical protein